MGNLVDKHLDPQEEEPKIFGIHIDGENNKRFDRRDFIKAAAFTTTAAILASCEFMPAATDADTEKTRVADSVRKTVNAMDGEADEVAVAEEVATAEPTWTMEPTETAQPTETPVPTESTPRGEVNTAHNIFMGPDTNHPLAGKTVVGEEVTILGQTPDGTWFNIVDSEGTTGWVFATYISVTSGFGEIPVSTNYPTPPAVEGTCKGKVNKAHSLWEGPNTNHPVVGKTKLDEEVTILGKTKDEGWYKIKTSDETIGWGYSTFITLTTCDIDEVEVPNNIPTPPAAPCECDSYNACDCDEYVPGCECDEYSSYCTCDTVHYWYPN